MKTLGVGEIKARFSDILEQVKGGEKIAVGYGKKKTKVAMIVPYEEYKPEGQRKLGPLKGKATFKVCAGFKMSDEELLTR
jgi:antitoxin (DNA-binding transcriptional repressor) of toxin-antitoxin stability system